jgi:hypothetical protein
MDRFLLSVASIGMLVIGLAPSLRGEAPAVLTVSEAIPVPLEVRLPATLLLKQRDIIPQVLAGGNDLQGTFLASENSRSQPAENSANALQNPLSLHPLIGLAGLFSLAIFVVLHAVRASRRW